MLLNDSFDKYLQIRRSLCFCESAHGRQSRKPGCQTQIRLEWLGKIIALGQTRPHAATAELPFAF
jgi:hypothetical protein